MCVRVCAHMCVSDITKGRRGQGNLKEKTEQDRHKIQPYLINYPENTAA